MALKIDIIADFLANSYEVSDSPIEELVYVSGINKKNAESLLHEWGNTPPKMRMMISMDENSMRSWIRNNKRKSNPTNDDGFDEWQKESKRLQDAETNASHALRKITGDTGGGLTPDHIKNSTEYKIAKHDFNRAFAALREFNKNSPKKFQQMASSQRRMSRKSNPSKMNQLSPELVSIVAKYNKGKKLEEFLEGIRVINESLALGGWIPRGSVSSGKARKLKIGIDEGEREKWLPYDGKSAERTPFYKLISALRSFYKFDGTDEEMALAVSQLTPQELKKYPEEYILSFLLLAKEINEAVRTLDLSRKLPVITPIGLSPRVTTTLKEMRLDIDLSSIRMAEIDFIMVPRLWPRGPQQGEVMVNSRGEVMKEPHYFVVWSPNIKHRMSRFHGRNQCQVCGKGIPSGRFVPIEAFDKNSQSLVSFWAGQDCASNIFGIKDVGIGREKE